MRHLIQSLRPLMLGLSASLALGACGKSVVDEMESVRKQTCECPDNACIDKLIQQTRALETKMSNLSEADHKKAIRISMETMKCATRFRN